MKILTNKNDFRTGSLAVKKNKNKTGFSVLSKNMVKSAYFDNAEFCMVKRDFLWNNQWHSFSSNFCENNK